MGKITSFSGNDPKLNQGLENNFQKVIDEYNANCDLYYHWDQKETISSGDRERAKDILEILQIKDETDFFDQVLDFLNEYVNFVAKWGPAVLGTLLGGVPIPGVDDIDLLKEIKEFPGIDKEFGKEAADKIKGIILKYAKDASVQFYSLNGRQQLIAWGIVTKYLYENMVSGELDAAKKGQGKNKKQVINRILFYKNVLSNWTLKFNGDLPDFKFNYDMAPQDFAQLHSLYRLRLNDSHEIDEINEFDKFCQVYRLHEKFHNDDDDAIKNGTKQDNSQSKTNKAGVLFGIAGAAIGLLKK